MWAGRRDNSEVVRWLLTKSMTIRVGLVGTGYAARVRAEAFREDVRSRLVAVAGRDYLRTAEFAGQYGATPFERWQVLVNSGDVDLVVVATVSALHGDVVEAALEAGKHVVVEYPLSLELSQAERSLKLAAEKGLLLHVEHIELLGGLHQAMQTYLPEIGRAHYVNYRTLNPQHPAPTKWTYCLDLFGFPFCGALSRVHRLTNLFGAVAAVECATHMVPTETAETSSKYFKSILSSGRLRFENGVMAELTYGKGEQLWTARRDVEIQGSLGALCFVRNEGVLTTTTGSVPVAVAPRRGLFVKDTAAVLDYLTEGTRLYVSSEDSVYALKVGDAMRRASQSGRTVELPR